MTFSPKQTLINFLNLHRLSNDDEQTKPTHLSYGSFNGKFNIPETIYNDFINLYTEAINDNANLSIIEKVRDNGPILIDIDINNKELGPNGRLYDDSMIESIIKIYNQIIKPISNNNNYTFYLMEKPEPTIKNESFKDGFHIVVPDLHFNTETRFYIREQAVLLAEQENIFSAYALVESIDSIIDKAVVSSNGWFLYGSNKPGCKPYKVTSVLNSNLEIVNNNESIPTLINKFSFSNNSFNLIGKSDLINLKISNNKFENLDNINDNKISNDNKIYTLDYYKDLLAILGEEYKTNHDLWMKIGFACYSNENVDGEYFDLWAEFSQCNKYKLSNSELKKIWKTIKTKNHNGFTFKSISYIVKKDYPEEWKALIKKHFPKESKLDDSYDLIKNKFELTHFKINNPIVYVQLDNDSNEMIIKEKHKFKDTYENLFYSELVQDAETNKTKTIKKEFISQWMKDPNIRTYDKWDFIPGQGQENASVYNTFLGWEGSFIEPNAEPINIKDTLIYKHIQNICGNLDDVTTYFNMFISRKLRQPSNLTNTAMVIKSIEGCGKDTLLDWIGHKIIGSKMYANDSKMDLFFGQFNSQLENKVLIVLNEVEGIKAFEHCTDIKDGITRKINTIEKKGMTPFNNTNNTGWIFLTNSDNPVKIEATNRRFMAFESNNSIANNKIYFDNLRNEMNNKEVIRAFFDYWIGLTDSDTYDFTNERPKTNYYNNITQLNITPMTHWLVEEVNENDNDNKRFTTNELFNKYNDYVTIGKFNAPLTLTKFTIEIKKYNGIESHRTNKNNGFLFDYKLLKEYLVKSKGVSIEDVNFIDV